MIPFIIDAVKFLIEYTGKPEHPEFAKLAAYTAVLPCCNEQDLIDQTLNSLQSVDRIITVVNGTTDQTAAVCREHKTAPVLLELEKGCKLNAIACGLEQVQHDYTLIMDADTVVPVPPYQSAGNALIAYPVMPLETKTFIQKLQFLEYGSTMLISKPWNAKNTVMASGACALGSTELLKRGEAIHSRVYQGEDLERSLIWQLKGNKVVYDSSVTFYTDVPATWTELFKQRFKHWNPGLLRLLPLMVKVALRSASWKCRLQLWYEVLATIADPLKILYILILPFPITLPFSYMLYLVMAAMLVVRLGKQFTLKEKLCLTIVYPVYTMLLMFCRLASWFRHESNKTTHY